MVDNGSGRDAEGFIRNLGIFPQVRGDKLEGLVRGGKVGLDLVLRFIGDENVYIRSSVARSLGFLGGQDLATGRKVFPYLVRMMCDPEVYVRGDAILTLCESGDSRITFVLFNYFNNVGFEERKRILIGLSALKDPRAVCFLEGLISERGVIGDLAKDAYSNCLGNVDFRYRFSGREEMWDTSRERRGILVNSPEVLDRNCVVLGRSYERGRPQTYVVDNEGLWIGGELEEHVDVAGGNDVLSAGEIIIIKDGKRWRVENLNNRSNGYYPDKASFFHVAKALESAGILYDGDSFSEVFPRGGYCDSEFLQFHPFYEGIGLDFAKWK